MKGEETSSRAACREDDPFKAIAEKLIRDLSQLSSSISSCRRCQGGRGGIPGEGQLGSELLLLAGLPGPGAHRGNPWGEWRSEVFRRAIDEWGWKTSEIYLSTAMRCPGRKANLADLRRCSAHLAEEFFTVGPKLVVVSGKIAAVGLRAALGDEVPERPKAGDSFRLFSSHFLFNLDISRIGREKEAAAVFWDVLRGAENLLGH